MPPLMKFTLMLSLMLSLMLWVFAMFYFLCNNGIDHIIFMVRRNIWYVCPLYISLHHIKILNGCEKLMYVRWASVDYFFMKQNVWLNGNTVEDIM